MPGSPTPSVRQWQQLWRLWDAATLDMIPPGHHTDRPLELRQPVIFYLGHLPAFTDARLARVLQQATTEHFAHVFARGIDPDLDDPSQCHTHSPTPASGWPDVGDILAYRDRVRARIMQLYADAAGAVPSRSCANSAAGSSSCGSASSCKPSACCHKASRGSLAAAAAAAAAVGQDDVATVAAMPAQVQHVLWMGYEHEAMHLETLMYLLVQYQAVQPPPHDLLTADIPPAAWHSSLAAAALENQHSSLTPGSCAVGGIDHSRDSLLPLPPAASWVQVPSCQVTLGFTPDAGMAAGSCCQSGSGTGSHSRGHLPSEGMETDSSASQGMGQPLRFGWDNECPAMQVSVAGLQVQHRAVTVLEYLQFVACRLTDSLTANQALLAAGATRSNAPLPIPAGGGCSTAGKQHFQSASTSTSSSVQVSCSTSASGDSNLPVALAGMQPSRACVGCQQTLLQLLQGACLLPASLALLSPEAAPNSAPTSAADCHLQLPYSSSSSGGGSCCTGLCQLLTTCSCRQHMQQLLLDSLQLHLGVKTVFGAAPISVSGYWPVYCSALQAEQYAAWAGSSKGATFRLPTEPELLAACQHNREVSAVGCVGVTGRGPKGVGFSAWHPICVPLLPDPAAGADLTCADGSSEAGGASAAAVHQLRDNGWEWTSTAFARHDGFQPHPLYQEYSEDFFGGKHVVLLGGSWATVDSIAARCTFRNWYQKGQQHVFSKFRLCRSADG